MHEPHVFTMPSLGADMDAGTVLEWLVEPGAEVTRGDIVAVVRTDKADIEVEVFEGGTIGELLVAEGTRVPVGTPLATILSPGAATAAAPADHGRTTDGDAATAGPAPREARPASPPVPPPPSPVPPPFTGGRPPASPRARRLAADRGVDLSSLTDAARGRPVTGADVEAATGAPGVAPDREPAAAVPPSAQAVVLPVPVTTPDAREGVRRAIANVMARSKREIPHYYLQHRVDLAHTLVWLTRENETRSVDERLLPAALFYKAVALAARDHPAMNGFWSDDAHRPSESVHLGVAIALRGGGLVAPAIHDADRLTLTELMGALRDLIARTRAGRLRRAEMADPTITVTNLGDQGVEAVFPVIYPPQVAIVGFGKVTEQAWAEDGRVGARPTVSLTLAADHRVSDGLTGARFLADVERLLHRPEDL